MKMEDIAKLANVSKSAVSLAFSGKPGIGPDTRERILQVAHEAGYSPKSKTITASRSDKSLLFLVCTNSGIVLEEYYQQPFFKELIQFIEERCRQKGYSLIFSTVDVEFFQRDIQMVAEEKRSAGTIVLGTNLTREQISDIHGKLPNLIVLDTCFDTLPVQFIQINNVMGAYQAGAYLCDMGHTSIGYIASNVRIHNFEERKRGFFGGTHGTGAEDSGGTNAGCSANHSYFAGGSESAVNRLSGERENFADGLVLRMRLYCYQRYEDHERAWHPGAAGYFNYRL